MKGNLFFIFYSGRYLLNTPSKRILLLGAKNEVFEPWNSQC